MLVVYEVAITQVPCSRSQTHASLSLQSKSSRSSQMTIDHLWGLPFSIKELTTPPFSPTPHAASTYTYHTIPCARPAGRCKISSRHIPQLHNRCYLHSHKPYIGAVSEQIASVLTLAHEHTTTYAIPRDFFYFPAHSPSYFYLDRFFVDP
jgi:hypothetical protein